MRRSMIQCIALLLPVLAVTAPLHAQSRGTFLDPGAEQLLARARAFRDAADSTILSYTGTVHSRLAAGLRMPLKDRTLYRRESTARIRWSRSAPPILKAIAFREQTPAGITAPGMGNAPSLDELFDPTMDRIYFGLTDNKSGDNDVWIQHPLVAGAEKYYRYQSGDTLSIQLQDGRTIRAIELRVTPVASSGHVVSGSLWIDATNGTVVQAVYRLSRPLDIESEVLDDEDRKDMKYVPGMFRPIVFDISLVAVEYGLYDLRYWMPRVTRLEGSLRAGVMRAPASYEISYDIDEVITATPATVAAEAAAADSVTDAWRGTDHYMGVRQANGRKARVLMPFDSLSLMSSKELPPPIWKKNAEFITDRELNSLYDRLGDVATPASAAMLKPKIVWGPGASDLMRFNRVEGLSVGVRASYDVPRIHFQSTARLGYGDMHPDIDLSASRISPRHATTLAARHALASVDPVTDAFGMGNSMSGVLLGRDDGEYYRTTGASLSFMPAEEARQSWDVSFFVQRDEPVSRNTNVSLRSAWDRGFRFRPNIVAAKTNLAGMSIGLHPWWGSDPFRVQGGIDALVDGSATGYRYARARVTARTAIPLGSRYRAGIEAGAGSATGSVPPQRLWYLGGASTLRGYDGSSLSGTTFGRGRVDLARTFGWGALTVFSDAGWTGTWNPQDAPEVLYSAGVGSSLLDGLLRADIARTFSRTRQWRLELYVDALL